jgi:hypothetical protein
MFDGSVDRGGGIAFTIGDHYNFTHKIMIKSHLAGPGYGKISTLWAGNMKADGELLDNSMVISNKEKNCACGKLSNLGASWSIKKKNMAFFNNISGFLPMLLIYF